MSLSLPKDAVKVIQEYGRVITFENLWNYHDVNSILSVHNHVPPAIAVEFENQALLWRRIDEYHEHRLSSFKSQVSELNVSPECAQLLISFHQERPRAAEIAYYDICSDTSENGGDEERIAD